MDSEGRLYVGDRWNNRIQVFDHRASCSEIYTQFGRPSGIYIDKHDIMYVTDSESRAPVGYGYHPGWKRGSGWEASRTASSRPSFPIPPGRGQVRDQRRGRHRVDRAARSTAPRSAADRREIRQAVKTLASLRAPCMLFVGLHYSRRIVSSLGACWRTAPSERAAEGEGLVDQLQPRPVGGR